MSSPAPRAAEGATEVYQQYTALQQFHHSPETCIGRVNPQLLQVRAVGWRNGTLHALGDLPDAAAAASKDVKSKLRQEAEDVAMCAEEREKGKGEHTTPPAEAPSTQAQRTIVAFAAKASGTAAREQDTLTGAAAAKGKPLHLRTCSVRMALWASPALLVTFNEILQNAMDRVHHDAAFKTLHVDVCVDDDGVLCCRVRNDGVGLPVRHITPAEAGEGHPEGGALPLLPTAIFSSFNFGSNYHKDRAGYAGGRNGKGSKLTNATSHRFHVRVHDAVGHTSYEQTWRKRCTEAGGAITRASASKRGFVEVQWTPDMAFFGMQRADARVKAWLEDAVWGAAAWLQPFGVKVHLNGVVLPVKSWQQFAAVAANRKHRVVCEEGVQRAVAGGAAPPHDPRAPPVQVGIVPAAKYGEGGVRGYVNGLRVDAGVHVDVVLGCLAERFSASGSHAVKTSHVQAMFHVTLRCCVPHPRFDSNTKTVLDTHRKRLGWRWSPSEGLVAGLLSHVKAHMDVVHAAAAQVADVAAANRKLALAGAKGGKARVSRAARSTRAAKDTEKYTPATNVRPGSSAVLLVCEGDSAASMATEGRSVIGAAAASVLVLKGKPLNVQGCSLKAIAGNAEIAQLATALGLQFQEPVRSLRQLCHRKVVVMADQDDDGGHIAALVYNAIAVLWPDVLVLDPGFVQVFATPLHKVWLAPASPDSVLSFYSDAAHDAWRREHTDARIARHKRYKGLGTHTSAEQRAYFQDMASHVMTLHTGKGHSPEAALSRSMLGLYFCKKENAARGDEFLEHGGGDGAGGCDAVQGKASAPFPTWLRSTMMRYAHAANTRAIPHVVDGLKRVHRQVLWTLLGAGGRTAPATAETKVSTLTGTIVERTHYAHGPVSVENTLREMVKWFTGHHNVPMLLPAGSAGNRVTNHAAAARYLMAKLSPVARAMFPPQDEGVLPRAEAEGVPVEVQHYAPVVPFLLWTGALGVAWGNKCECAPLCPRDVITATRRVAAGDDDAGASIVNAAAPWYDSFIGTTERLPGCDTKWRQRGVYTVEQGVTPSEVAAAATASSTVVRVHVWELPAQVHVKGYLASLQSRSVMSEAAVEAADEAARGSHAAVHAWRRAEKALRDAKAVATAPAPEDSEGGGKSVQGAALPPLKAAGGKKKGASVKQLAARVDKARSAVEALRSKCVLAFHDESLSNAVHIVLELHPWAAAPLLQRGGVLPPWDLHCPDMHTGDASVQEGLRRVRDAGGMQLYPKLEAALSLVTTLPQQYKAWDADGRRVVEWKLPGDVLLQHAAVRRSVYAARKDAMVQSLRQKVTLERGKAQFVRGVVSGALSVVGLPDAAGLHRALDALGVPRNPSTPQEPFAYLTRIASTCLHEAFARKAEAAAESAAVALRHAEAATVSSMWTADLDALEAATLETLDLKRCAMRVDKVGVAPAASSSGASRGTKRRGGALKHKAAPQRRRK